MHAPGKPAGQDEVEIGRKLAHYTIVEKIGAGGMGEVYRAEDSKLGRKVALKVLPSAVAADPERLERFQREARTVAGLRHPNIVTLHAVEEEAGVHFLTMELVEGETLSKRVPSDGMALEELFALAIPMADAVAAAHERGVVHRDLKPDNVMVESRDRVKVLDFGLAKLCGPAPDVGSSEAPTAALTGTGQVMGTVPYMSPEQLQGQDVDARSDVFSLGVMFYEMATGRRPFRADSSAGLISAILRDAPPPLDEIRDDLPHHLGRIVRRCLEKEPERRYHSALDVRNELEDLRREVVTATVAPEARSATTGAADQVESGGRRRLTAPLVALSAVAPKARLTLTIAAAAVLALVLWATLWPRVAEEPTADAGRTRSLAVLYFDNLSGDPALDWLRNGLADLLVTDLSQSPDLMVLSTDRLYQILKDLRQLDERVTSSEVVREVAERAGVHTVILGSFVKVGETIRVSVKIQEAESGTILATRKIDVVGEEELFSRVDALAADIRRDVEPPRAPAGASEDLDNLPLERVTTSSVEAYRYFIEAGKLHRQVKEEEAIALYEKAVEADPGFALALAKLATAHKILGDVALYRQYLKRAVEQADRLTELERAYVEGQFYRTRRETWGRAVEVFERALARHPDANNIRGTLGILLGDLERFDESIEYLEEALRRGEPTPVYPSVLAASYAGRGDFQEAHRVLDEYLRRFPDSFSSWIARADLLRWQGRTDEAAAALAEASRLRPGSDSITMARCRLALLRQDWEAVESLAAELERGTVTWASLGAASCRGIAELLHGRVSEQLALAERIAVSDPESGRTGTLYQTAMLLSLSLGRFDRAVEHAQATRRVDRDFLVESLAWEAVARQALGQQDEADRTAAELSDYVDRFPQIAWERTRHLTRGYLTAMRGDLTAAVSELTAAETMLPPARGLGIRFALGRFHLFSGRTEEAAERFRLIVLSAERIDAPFEYARSLFLLGRIHEERDEADAARGYYQRFVDLWGDGELDREDVEHAVRFLKAG